MRFHTALSLATLFVVCFIVASWATLAPDGLAPANPAPTPDNPSQSGKIASIGAFSHEVANGQEKKTTEFLVDDDTKAEGKLKAGSQATVESRSAVGRNIAVHVVVAPDSGFKAW